jgi:phosphoribosyl-ATP pyrophosphohydrolase
MGERTVNVQLSDLGEVLASLTATIHGRRIADPQESYTAKLLKGPEDYLLKKVVEEATEVALASKDADHDHIRYEAGDLVYHLLVVLERYGVTSEELAGELSARMPESPSPLP